MKKYGLYCLCLVLVVCASSGALAQEVQLLFTSAVMQKALDYKERLTADKLGAKDALSLHNASAKRQAAFLTSIASTDAVIILGKVAFKAVAEVAFPMVVVTVDAIGENSVKGPIIHVFDAESDVGTTGGAKIVSVSDVGKFSLSAGNLKSGAVTVVKCQKVGIVEVLNKLLSEIKRLNAT